jgi:hypothetical protein
MVPFGKEPQYHVALGQAALVHQDERVYEVNPLASCAPWRLALSARQQCGQEMDWM